ncbi:protein kinase [Nonomuraea sp. NPDC048826]|uniref:protein kinase domain-containing protein n=1 Tax=Nonomuraea sp. NPDC048826 TaxID=3364347 RepID=UPI0037203F22
MDRQVGNRYRLVESLGEGGMGVVWRAYDELLDRTVAIKEVRYSGVGEAQRAELNRRTIREARAAGRLDHPSVVVIHDVVEEDGRPWIVMQLVRSRSLAEVIRDDGPLPAPRAAMIGARVLDALRAAHATGVLHRDVKPENVLLADDGRVVLTDFGIATLESESGLTATGSLVGTPAYMPPERLNGEPARPESDLWSLGATLYAAVEGAPPFRRESWAATVAAVLRDAVEPPRRAGALTPVIMGWLQRDPGARMPADQAAHLLGAASTGGPPYGFQGPQGAPQQDPGGPYALPGSSGPPGTSPQGPGTPPQGSPYGTAPQGGPYAVPGAQGTAPQGGSPQGPGGSHGRPGAFGTVPGGARQGGKRWVVAVAAAAVIAVVGAGGAVLLTRSGDDRELGVEVRTTSAGDATGRPGATGEPDEDGTPAQSDRTGGATPGPTNPAGNATPDPVNQTGDPTLGPTNPTGDSTAGPTYPAGDATPDPGTSAGAQDPAGRRVPAGWRVYRSPGGGFSVAMPRGWRVVKNPRRDSITFSGPGSPGMMIVEWTVPEGDHATPAAHWRALEREILAKGEFPGYARIRIRSLTYQGRPAADWEFTRPRDGARIRVVNRGFTTADGRPFALYWETTAARWERDRRFFETFARTFRPTP